MSANDETLLLSLVPSDGILPTLLIAEIKIIAPTIDAAALIREAITKGALELDQDMKLVIPPGDAP